MIVKNFIPLFLAIFLSLSCGNGERDRDSLRIGNYYADVLHGITFKFDNNRAFVFRIGYLDSTGRYIETYNEHLNTLPDKSGQKFGPAAPDYSYNQYGFTTDKNNIIWIEWSIAEGKGCAVGKIYSTRPQDIYVEAMQAWPDSPRVHYKITKTGFEGHFEQKEKNADWSFVSINNAPAAFFGNTDSAILLSKFITGNQAVQPSISRYYSSAAIKYSISKDNPLYFVAGIPADNFTQQQIDLQLKTKLSNYTAQRVKLETPFGEMWEAVSNHLNASRVYGTQTKTTGHVVSRGWCDGHNQRLFEWDSFFQAMLASIEDPEGGKETVRSILAHQTPIGIVPNHNYGNDTVQNSNDRSQPPVGAICVWKMHQYHPDRKFLEEVYPKLMKWHNWWFSIRPENGLPYRDGNRNGLLEWGSEEASLQFAKYESGQDNSPMFDDARMNENSRTMELDMAGLSALWAADALYLSYIANELGKKEDGDKLLQEVTDISQRINQILWNEEVGMYCNKYWDAYSRKPQVEVFNRIPFQAFSGPINFKYPQAADTFFKTVRTIGLTKAEAGDFHRKNIPVSWTFKLKPAKTGVYFFHTPEETGVLLAVNNQVVIDNRAFWITEFISDPVYMEAGKTYDVSLTYSGDIEFELKWATEQKINGSLFSEKLGPTLFYPLITKMADVDRSKKIMANLLDTNLFWGNYVIPTIARNDPAFPTQGYWRGRIWPPTNYLAYMGIKQCASPSVVWQFALKSAEQAQAEWEKRGHLYENYYADGIGAGDSHYCWGGLMQFMLLEELDGMDEKGKHTRNIMADQRFKVEY